MKFSERVSLAWQTLTKGVMPNIYGIQDYQLSGDRFSGRSKSERLKAYASWVYACINIRAKAVAAAEFELYAKGRGGMVEIEEHPFLDLISEVNPFDTRYELWNRTVSHLDLVGDAYWYIPKTGLGIPGQIWMLPPDKMTVVPSKTDFISGYVLQQEDKKIPFAIDEVIHFKYPNPNDPYYGMSPLMAAAASVEIDTDARLYQRAFYKNSAIPAMALTTDQKLNDSTFKRLQADWATKYQGSQNAGRTAILEQGMKVERIGVSPSELDWLDTMRATRDDILAIYGVPASMLGLVEDVNRANAEANQYVFASNVIEPILTMFDERLTQDLARKYDSKLIVQHESTIPEDDEAEIRVAKMRLDAGLTTRNEERLNYGYAEIEGGEVLLVPGSLRPLSQIISGTASPVEPKPQE